MKVLMILVVLFMGCALDQEMQEDYVYDNNFIGSWESIDGVQLLFDEEYVTITYSFKDNIYKYEYSFDDDKIIILNNKMFTSTYTIEGNYLYIKDITFIKISNN
jgi:hypothetical protein